MKSMKILALAALVACTPFAAFANSVVFTNNDGTFTSSGVTSGTLTLSQSTLIGIQGLTPYVPDSSVTPPASIGSLTLTTGSMTSGSILTNATFGAGGNITFTYSNGVVFTGSFSSAGWTLQGTGSNTWIFSGTVMNGILTVPGYNPVTIGTAVTVDLTTVGAAPTASGNGYSFSDSQGTTNFTAPALAPIPEPGTLTLLGGGLVAVAMLAKRWRSKNEDSSN